MITETVVSKRGSNVLHEYIHLPSADTRNSSVFFSCDPLSNFLSIYLSIIQNLVFTNRYTPLLSSRHPPVSFCDLESLVYLISPSIYTVLYPNGGVSHALEMAEAAMAKSIEIPDCCYPKEPVLVRPSSSKPRHTLYLSNLDDQKFLRFSIKYLYVYKRSVGVEALTTSLSKVLVEYHPLAGRLRPVGEDGEKCQVDCNGEGALLAEAYVDLTAEEFLQGCGRPNRSWRKLLYRVEAQSFLDVPPLVVQVSPPLLLLLRLLLCFDMLYCSVQRLALASGVHALLFIGASISLYVRFQ